MSDSDSDDESTRAMTMVPVPVDPVDAKCNSADKPLLAPEPKAIRGSVYQMTWNNYPEGAIRALTILVERGRLRAFGCRPEIGGEKKTPHLQGWVQMAKPGQRYTAIQKMLKSMAYSDEEVEAAGDSYGVFFQAAKGTIAQNAHYAQKPVDGCECKHCADERVTPTAAGNYVQKGDPIESKQGARTDLDAIRDRLKTESLLSVADTDFAAFARSYRAFEKYQYLVLKDAPKPAPIVTVCWGPTSTGKSYSVRAKHGLSVYCPPTYSTAWWHDGYEPLAHKVILIEEFHSNVPYRELLKYLDVYPYQVCVKGGFLNFIPTHIYITTPYHPVAWYPNIVDKRELMRRIHHIVEFKPNPDLIPAPRVPSESVFSGTL